MIPIDASSYIINTYKDSLSKIMNVLDQILFLNPTEKDE